MKKSTEIDMLNDTLWDKIPRFALPVAATAVLVALSGGLSLTAILIFLALLYYRPSKRQTN